MESQSWRSEYLEMKLLSDEEVKLLKYGARSLCQSWRLGAMYSDWKKKKGIIDPPDPVLTSTFKEWSSGQKRSNIKGIK